MLTRLVILQQMLMEIMMGVTLMLVIMKMKMHWPSYHHRTRLTFWHVRAMNWMNLMILALPINRTMILNQMNLLYLIPITL